MALARADARGWGPGWPNCGGRRIVVAIAGANQIRLPVDERIALLAGGLANTLERARGRPFNRAWCWGYACRSIAGSSTPSNHSWGLAIDLDAPANPQRRPLTTDMPPGTSQIAASYGFRWGGEYTDAKPDPMHFEFVGTPADAGRLTKQFLDAVAAALKEKPKVQPQFNPPLKLEPIVAQTKAPGGGVWAMAANGSMYALGGADFIGGLNGNKDFRGRRVARIRRTTAAERRRSGYKAIVTATSGEHYGLPVK